ncbi:uncharacterized protein LOC132901619 isoform X2 [Neoarius graeffei]|uniref:uncharacterized protein LOC132901619 isoform X2 n=1 Tax=Neoarius graeffei TaxID=443677 RepID=UPI00298C06F5|nr:uncharacterized protein LOC132901619 isoform X2 [Neoarius graeffei]
MATNYKWSKYHTVYSSEDLHKTEYNQKSIDRHDGREETNVPHNDITRLLTGRGPSLWLIQCDYIILIWLWDASRAGSCATSESSHHREMPSNVEIKAWLRDLDHVTKRARELSGSDGTIIRQHDTFFHTREEGRLKLRDLLRVLSDALGQVGQVKKERRLYMVGQTRVHVDSVEGLGDFMELEVVMRENQSAEEGVAIAHQLMQDLGMKKEDLIDGAYMDLLLAKGLQNGK